MAVPAHRSVVRASALPTVGVGVAAGAADLVTADAVGGGALVVAAGAGEDVAARRTARGNSGLFGSPPTQPCGCGLAPRTALALTPWRTWQPSQLCSVWQLRQRRGWDFASMGCTLSQLPRCTKCRLMASGCLSSILQVLRHVVAVVALLLAMALRADLALLARHRPVMPHPALVVAEEALRHHLRHRLLLVARACTWPGPTAAGARGT